MSDSRKRPSFWEGDGEEVAGLRGASSTRRRATASKLNGRQLLRQYRPASRRGRLIDRLRHAVVIDLALTSRRTGHGRPINNPSIPRNIRRVVDTQNKLRRIATIDDLNGPISRRMARGDYIVHCFLGDRLRSERELLRSTPGRYPNSLKITAITPFKVIQGHRFWYQSKAHTRLPISD